MSKTATEQTQTCAIRMKQGRLLDSGFLQRHLDAWHLGVKVRGIEVTAEGRVWSGPAAKTASDAPETPDTLFRLASSGEIVRLRPFAHKVQWDVPAKRAQPITASERAASERLRKLGRTLASPLRITGTLTGDAKNGYRDLEVREFRALTGRQAGRR